MKFEARARLATKMYSYTLREQTSEATKKFAKIASSEKKRVTRDSYTSIREKKRKRKAREADSLELMAVSFKKTPRRPRPTGSFQETL